LCLYLAALRSNTNPPSVPLPHSANDEPVVLGANTCPPAFANFFALWASSVGPIKKLTTDQRHDLARAICDQPLQSSNPHPATNRIAADLRAAAIEISQRRTFQVGVPLRLFYRGVIPTRNCDMMDFWLTFMLIPNAGPIWRGFTSSA
jgi:hypothetical protein